VPAARRARRLRDRLAPQWRERRVAIEMGVTAIETGDSKKLLRIERELGIP
jgi:hypothetical protein